MCTISNPPSGAWGRSPGRLREWNLISRIDGCQHRILPAHLSSTAGHTGSRQGAAAAPDPLTPTNADLSLLTSSFKIFSLKQIHSFLTHFGDHHVAVPFREEATTWHSLFVPWIPPQPAGSLLCTGYRVQPCLDAISHWQLSLRQPE